MNLQAFDLNLLKTFDCLMEVRSVSKAAQCLSLTQPAVSNALARLRKLLDDPLLVRTKQGMEPTPRALSLLGPVKESLQALEQALMPVADFNPLDSSERFTIAAPDFVGVSLLSELLPRWQKSAPMVSLSVQHLSSKATDTELEDGGVDLAIGRFFEVPGRLRRKMLQRQELVCLLAADHPHTEARMSLPQFLELQHVWVSNSGRRGMVDHWLDKQHKSRNVVAVVSTYTAGALLVAETSLGLVVAQGYARYFAARLNVRCVELDFDLGNFTVDMLWHPFRESDPAHKWLRHEISSCREFQ